MFKGNLLKAAWNTVNTDDVKVIDSNAMLEKRLKEISATLQEHEPEEIQNKI